MHRNSFLLFEKYAQPYFDDAARVLEIGPSEFPSAYCAKVFRPAMQWDTLDIAENSRLTYSGVGEYSFPVDDSTYDIVFSGQVLEHVRKIWRWMPELARVTKPGGLVITLSPVSYPYHAAPHDCWRAHPEGMRALCEDSGLVPELCLSESVEGAKYRRIIGGRGADRVTGPKGLIWKSLALFGFPMQVAIDLVTVARKPK
ncbi:MAG: methyltransferase domain-containing protein [Proteobacteria bacterium]|mgnify:CR=1 FL=1|nr:methyltransferase domain-containing protein [Pseudomonadota bacterium]